MKLSYIPFICFLLLIFYGCAKPPVAEMTSAREAVFRAENDSGAVAFGGAFLARARDELRLMEAAADSKQYDTAKAHAAEAIIAAERAITDGRTSAVRAREEAASLLADLKPEIDETARNVAGARNSNMDLDYNALDRDITRAYERADLAQADHSAGRYQDALEKSKSVRADLFDINQKVANAVTRRK
jgi:hypothetical protein